MKSPEVSIEFYGDPLTQPPMTSLTPSEITDFRRILSYWDYASAHHAWGMLGRFLPLRGIGYNWTMIEIEREWLSVGQATIFSALVSMRTLNEFFQGGKLPDDLQASKFSFSRGAFLTAAEVKQINKNLAHFTTSFVQGALYQFSDMVLRCTERLLEFARHVQPRLPSTDDDSIKVVESRITVMEYHLNEWRKALTRDVVH